MKRLFFFLIVVVASVLPQSVWAEVIKDSDPAITKDGSTLTINSTTAGSLKTLMDGWKTKGDKTDDQQAADNAKIASMKTCTSVKLEGKFQGNDLSAISNTQGFNFTVVDMAAAQFVKSISSTGGAGSYKLFKNITTPSTMDGALGANFGDRAILDGTLYVSARTPQWDNMSPNYPAEGTTVAEITSTSDIAGHSIGEYGKISKSFVYIQMSVGAASWSTVTTQSTSNATYAPNKVSEITEANMNTNNYISYYNEGETVWFWRYYICEYNTEQNKWVWSYDYSSNESTWNSASATGSKYDNPYGVNLSNLDNGYAGEGNVMRVKVYYTKNVARSWSAAQTTEPSTYTIVDGDYVYSDNHKTGYSDGQWVRLIDYDYYQLQATGAWRWEQTEYNNGSSQFINVTCSNINDATAPGGANQYAIVLGTEYYYNGTNWTVAENGAEVSDYSQMKFSYWSSSLVTATTSRYADETINSSIFENCTHITHVDYLGGNLTGLYDRNSSYANFTVTIGKDVTKIQTNAFRQSSALTGVTFGGYAAGDAESRVYPKELTIESEAFMECTYLTSITIPNRVTYIGSNAFKHVGNYNITDKNNIGNYNGTFDLKFERRRKADDSSVAIECDFPLTIDNSAFFDCWYLRDLSLPIRLEKLGEDCFKNSYNLKTVVMREEVSNNTTNKYRAPEGHDLLRTIPSGAFHGSAVEELTIPQCVTLIENGAFGDTEHLKKLVFQNNSETTQTLADKTLVIKSGAFTGGKEEGRPQLDVYVMVNPADRKIVCEYQAFNFTQTVGQTSVSTTTPSFAYLHFPEDYWDYYQGNWKRGLAFRQDNLNAFKDGYNRDNDVEPDYVGKSNGEINRTTGKYETGTNGATIYTPGNGWQEFARTSTTIDIVIPNTGSFLRTYSTKTPKAIPLYAQADPQQGVRQGDPFFKVYRISHFDDKYTGSGSTEAPSSTNTPVATATEVKVHNDDASHAADNYTNAYIPKNTGLLMAGFGNGSVSYIVYMADITDNDNLTTYPWNASQNTEVVSFPNLLYPTCYNDPHTTRTTVDGVEYVVLNPTYPYPYASNTVPDYRFFGLAVRTVSEQKEYYFSRFIKNGKSTRDKAYLKLSNDVFHWTNEGPTASGSGLNNSSSARVALNFVEDDEEGETTSIKLVDTEKVKIADDSYYTLQGAKLNGRPTQRGIYIHNGRKVIVK